jgi:hypothetical protein
MVDPLKVEAILRLPPPRTIRQLFLRRFIVNYATITKGFMHLLKKETPFIWDERAQESFDALKKSLVSTPLLKPPEYDTIGMVLVQEDDELHKHVISYLSRTLLHYTTLHISHIIS